MKRSIWISEDAGCNNQACGGEDGGCLGSSSSNTIGIRTTKSSMGATTYSGAETGEPDFDITKGFHELTIEERNEAYEDMHGVTKPIEETPELVQKSLQELQHHLDTYSGPDLIMDRSSYDLAASRHPAFVQDTKFRLAFLRCDYWKPLESAIRFINYFALIHHLFGEHLLGRHITIGDLGPQEVKELKNGHIQFLLQRDSAGRAIQFLDPIKLMHIYAAPQEQESVHTRACLYLVMSNMLASVETQRNGVVSLVYGVDTRIKNQDEFKVPKARFLQSLSRCFRSVPIAIQARFQLHIGTAVECEYALMTYGFPVTSIPTNDSGVITYTKHMKSLAKLKTREQEQRKCNGVGWDDVAVLMPTRRDVLFGRGRPYQDHPGTLQMRALIAQYWEEYDSNQERGGKAAIAQRVVTEIQQDFGGRFLKLDSKTDWWFPVDDKEAISKVCQGFRKKREMNLIGSGKAKNGSSNNKRSRVVVPDLEESREEQKVTDPIVISIPPAVSPEPQDGEVSSSDPLTDALDGKELGYLLKGGAGEMVVDSLSQQNRDTVEQELDCFFENVEQETPLLEPAIVQRESLPGDDSDDMEPIKYHPPLAREKAQDTSATGLLSMDAASTLLSVLANNTSGETKIDETDPLLAFLESQRASLKCPPQQTFEWLKSQDIMTLADLQEACGDEDFLNLELKRKGGLKGFKSHSFVKAIASATTS